MTKIEAIKRLVPQSVYDAIPLIHDLSTNLRLAHFLSQCSHESQNFHTLSENLNYSLTGLIKTFPKYFNHDQAVFYQRNPIAIANHVYAGRMGNRDEASGDGYRFRGRGYIQLTGFNNYRAFGDFIQDDVCKNPDLVLTKYPLQSAAWFFTKNMIWNVCDRGQTPPVIEAVTRKINGGLNGLPGRIREFEIYRLALSL